MAEPDTVPTRLEAAGLAPDVALQVAQALEGGAGLDVPTLVGGGEETSLLVGAAVVAARSPTLLRDAVPKLLEALRCHREELPRGARAVARHLDGLAAWRIRNDVPAATRAFNESIHCLEEARPGSLEQAYAARVHDTLGQMLHHQGLLEDARIEFERALGAKEACGDASGLAITLGNLGRLCMELGAYEAAATYLERDLEHVETTGPDDPRLKAMLHTQIGACRAETGAWEDADRHLEAGLDLAAAAHDPVGHAFATVHRGRLEIRRGDLDAAGRAADDVRGVFADLPDAVQPELGGLVHQLAAEVALARGEVTESLARFFEASAFFERATRVSPVERAGLLEAWARACERADARHEAADRLRRALRALDATSAEGLRGELDARLKALDESAWMLHSAGRFVGHAQIDRLLSQGGRGGFRGREVPVTVLFSDLRRFTAVTEGLHPEVLIDVLNRYLANMTRCVEHFGGMVDKFIGDAVMAVFTLPEPLPDAADRALLAALYMQAELERFNRTLEEGMPRFEEGIGLHAGPVVAGLIGSPQKRSYTVIGDTVNTASRLEGMTKQLGVPVLVSEQVVQRLVHPERFHLVPRGRYRPKGRRGAVVVHEAVGERDGSCDPQSVDARATATEDALGLLAARRFDEAAARFAGLASEAGQGGGERGYALLAAAAADFAASPPPPDWDGSIELTEK